MTDELEELLGAYWDCAYQEGHLHRIDGNKANKILHDIREAIEQYRKDTERLDWLEQQGHAYGFHDMHEGNRWIVEGPFATLRQLADAVIAAAKGGKS